MKVRNDTDSDRFIFGVNFAMGAEVDISAFAPDKQAALLREFTEVKATMTETAPPMVETDDDEAVVVPPPPPRPYARRGRKPKDTE